MLHKLIVVGSGIKSISHLTEEAKKVIQHSDKVLYLINENNLKRWIEREAAHAESLETIYFSQTKRIDAYQAITHFIIEEYSKVTNLCVVFYGHPTVFADSALNAVKAIRAEGGYATILPAISAQDCLFSDLQIDPGERGFFSIEATELLLFERKIDPCAHIAIWQIANLGMFNTNLSTRTQILVDYLLSFYTAEQPICIYEAAMLPGQQPRMEWITFSQLAKAEIKAISTLYIPPSSTAKISKKYLSLLEMDLENFHLST